MVNKAFCRICIYRTYAVGLNCCCGYLLYTGKRRVPQMNPDRPDECPVMEKGDSIGIELGAAFFMQRSALTPSKKRDPQGKETDTPPQSKRL